jgi:phosphatidylglycerophosphate synthase
VKTANALTATRLLLAAPVALALARQDLLGPWVLFVLVWAAIATDYADGRVARSAGTASAGGQLFDHLTDCLFVTTSLAGAAWSGLVTPILPVLIVIAFAQYALDSYLLYRQKALRMSGIGRWNGIFYFVPIVVGAGARLPLFGGLAALLTGTVNVLGYALAASTVLSIIDRALAPLRHRVPAGSAESGSG